MIKEDLSVFADGKEMDEKAVATVVQSLTDTVIFQDDAGRLFFLAADSAAFEIGTVVEKAGLIPIEEADGQLKEKIYAALGKEEK